MDHNKETKNEFNEKVDNTPHTGLEASSRFYDEVSRTQDKQSTEPSSDKNRDFTKSLIENKTLPDLKIGGIEEKKETKTSEVNKSNNGDAPYTTDMAGARVGLWRDIHDAPDGKTQFIEALKDLQKNGVTHVAMENITRDNEARFNDYIQRDMPETERAKLREELKKTIAHTDDENLKEKVMDLVDKIKDAKLGLKIIGIEPDKLDPNGGNDQRDKVWDETIREKLKQADVNKIVVFANASHLEPTADELRKNNPNLRNFFERLRDGANPNFRVLRTPPEHERTSRPA